MDYAEHWTITWYGADGFEVVGWWNGSERTGRRWAYERMAELGAIRFEIERSD